MSKFNLSQFAYELALIAEYLARTELPQVEEAAAEIVQHAVEERFTREALHLVATVGVQHPDVSDRLKALLNLMVSDHIPADEQEPAERTARRLDVANLKEFMERLHAQQADKPPDSI
jgi:hypothetical protein